MNYIRYVRFEMSEQANGEQKQKEKKLKLPHPGANKWFNSMWLPGICFELFALLLEKRGEELEVAWEKSDHELGRKTKAFATEGRKRNAQKEEEGRKKKGGQFG